MWQRIKQRLFQTAWWQRHGKNVRETAYWRDNADRMVRWYQREEPFRLPFPTDDQRETRFDLRRNALLTYIRCETETASYLSDLVLRADSFCGLSVADIGSGPMPTLDVFTDCRKYCVDHLIDAYRALGYPLDHFEPETTFVAAKSESLPLPDNCFDVVLSRNALDHVDDFGATCREMLRVLRPEGWIHVQLHYHPPTSTEPQQLDDDAVLRHLGSRPIRKIREDRDAWGFDGGRTVVWSSVPPKLLARNP